MNNHVPLQEHVEKLFDEYKERIDVEQKAQDDKFEEFKKTLDTQGKLLAEKYKSDMAAYPNTEDFNELKEKVAIEVAAAMTKARAVPVLISVLALMIAVAAIFAPWWIK